MALGSVRSIQAFLDTTRDVFLLRCAGVFFVFWISCTGPLRWLAGPALPLWLTGSAPNFFAGLTLTFWQAFVVPSHPLGSAAVALAVLALVEAAQMAIPQHRADVWDLLASFVGCSVAVVALYGRRPRGQHEP